MAGRGRGMTLPAWMTAEPMEEKKVLGHNEMDKSREKISSTKGQFDDVDLPPSKPRHGDRDKSNDDRRSIGSKDDSLHRRNRRDDSRDRDRKKKSRSRSRDKKSRRRSRSRSREYSRDHRDRDGDRDRDRERDKDRGNGSSRSRNPSKSPDEPAKEWTARKKRVSNFDVKPPDGVVLPPFFASNASTAQESFSNHGGGGGGGGMMSMGGGMGGMGGMGMGGGGGGGVNSAHMQQTRHARRLYMGGIPAGTTENEVTLFFLDIIARALSKDSPEAINPVIQVYINHDKCFAFVELKSIELTTACCQLDGIQFKNASVKIRRPNDYKPELVGPHTPTPMNLSVLGLVGTTVADGPNKVFVGGLPYHLSEDNVKELLSAFGPLKAFHLVREPGSSNSKGYGFCEYMDGASSRIACEGLNNMQIGDKCLTVRVATSSGSSAGSFLPPPPPPPPLPSGSSGSNMNMNMQIYGLGVAGGVNMNTNTTTNRSAVSKVIVLREMVSALDLQDDLEYGDICDDVRQECSQYGVVNSVVIPRAKDGFLRVSEGSIFVEFGSSAMAQIALQALSGRKFEDRIVVAEYVRK
eukprot:gene7598-15567_t